MEHKTTNKLISLSLSHGEKGKEGNAVDETIQSNQGKIP